MPRELLDTVFGQICSDQVDDGMTKLFDSLYKIRIQSSGQEWRRLIDSTLLTHPIKEVIFADPITRRSFYKPRGYPGDAVLLDMIYRHHSIDFEQISGLGRRIFDYTSNNLAAKAVRNRRRYVAELIDETAAQRHRPRILSVASGHLREAEISDAIRNGTIGEFIALDQDIKSVQVVNRDYGRYGITACHGSVKDIIRKRFKESGFDFIYTCGLYDYLETKIARKLTSRLFEMLNLGGVLLVTNFLPAISAVGYMESFMGWNLIYRDESEMLDLVRQIPRKNIDRMQVVVEKEENIVFLHVHRPHPNR